MVGGRAPLFAQREVRQHVGHKEMMTKTGTATLLGASFVACVIHIYFSSRWLFIYLTKGNRKSIALYTDQALPFFLVLALLASAAWLSHDIRTNNKTTLRVASFLNAATFVFTGVLIMTHVIHIIK